MMHVPGPPDLSSLSKVGGRILITREGNIWFSRKVTSKHNLERYNRAAFHWHPQNRQIGIELFIGDQHRDAFPIPFDPKRTSLTLIVPDFFEKCGLDATRLAGPLSYSTADVRDLDAETDAIIFIIDLTGK